MSNGPVFPVEVTELTFQDLLDKARVLANRLVPGWDVEEINDPVVFLLEIYINAVSRGNFFANLMAQEFALGTARDRRSIVALAQRLGYTPATTQPARASVLLAYASQPGPEVIAPYDMRISTVATSTEEEPIFFENAEQIVLPAGTTSLVATFVQGVRVVESFTSRGQPFQKFLLSRSPVMLEEIVPKSFRVQVDGKTWTRVEGLASSASDDEHYVLTTDGDGIGEILFGDNIKGKTPPRDSAIETRYRVGGGVVGNVEQNTITRIVIAPSFMSEVNNIDVATGGQEAETDDHIKIFAPLSIAEGGQLNTLPIIRAELESKPSVARAKVFLDLPTKIKAAVITAPGVLLEQVGSQLRASILEKLIMGFDIAIVNPRFKEVDVSVRVFIEETALREAARDATLSQIDTWLNPLATDEDGNFTNDFGQDLRLSDLGFLLKEIPEVFDFEILEPTENIPIDFDEIVTNRHVQTVVEVEVVGGITTTSGQIPPGFIPT